MARSPICTGALWLGPVCHNEGLVFASCMGILIGACCTQQGRQGRMIVRGQAVQSMYVT